MIRREYITRHEKTIALFLLALGFALRLAAVGGLPYGLNQDEASAGYEAWALLNCGVDRCGSSLPALFVSWGSGQNVLMSYLAIPFIALMGPTELALRLPNAVFGCAALAAFWLFARRAGGKGFGLCALVVLALNPWHIMSCRWALESNLFPSLMMPGLLLTAMAKDKPWILTAAAAVFALSLYAYGTAFFFLPVFIIWALFYLGRDLRRGPTAVSALVFIVIALPISMCQLINMLELEPMSFMGLTLPRLTEARQTATSIFGGGSLSENLRNLFRLLWSQNDGLVYNALPVRYGGIFYFFGLPTAIIGFAFSVGHRKDRTFEAVMRIALVCALICGVLIRVNINRINMLWLPMVYFSALGSYLILCKLKRWAVLPLCLLLACFTLFSCSYVKTFGGRGNINYYPGLGEAIQYADSLGEEKIYITDYVNQPYIFALYYTRTPAQEFISSVEYADPSAAFRQVERFDGFEFRQEGGCGISVLGEWETGDRTVLTRFGRFAVCGSEK